VPEGCYAYWRRALLLNGMVFLILAMFLLGLAAAKVGVLEDLDRRHYLRAHALSIGYAARLYGRVGHVAA